LRLTWGARAVNFGFVGQAAQTQQNPVRVVYADRAEHGRRAEGKFEH